ncbi:DUF6529 family protein [Catelliglobosispora koreensis]|uniref:DUF6529 family protein n=1 Tax=Catelliglobosispora koreensis TaxID=129052 RepID=UPI000376BFEE|nr:DUF6529 family protein [Catelliglobosispora koreensis]
MASAARILIPLIAGAAVAVTLGVYGRVHQATGESVYTGPFSSVFAMKSWLATVVAVLAIWQAISALWMYGRLGRRAAPPWVRQAHRITGAFAFLVSVPVAYSCLWALGFQDYSPRVLIHSLLGCLLYGVFVTKMLALRLPGVPARFIPVAGGLVFATVIALWFTSSWWYFTNVGFPAW